MKFFLLPVAFVASLAAAQSSACGADYILEACLNSENAKFATCSEGDWDCKCSSYNNIMTCFNNCPNDSRRETQAGQQKIFCGYASQFPSLTPSAAGAAKTSAPSGGAAAATATPTGAGGSNPTGSSTSTGANPAKTNGAATDLAVHAGGVLALVAAVVAAAL